MFPSASVLTFLYILNKKLHKTDIYRENRNLKMKMNKSWSQTVLINIEETKETVRKNKIMWEKSIVEAEFSLGTIGSFWTLATAIII